METLYHLKYQVGQLTSHQNKRSSPKRFNNQLTPLFCLQTIPLLRSTARAPRNMIVYVPKCSSNALVSWDEPIATDNSGHVTVSYPAVRPPANLTTGLYNVHYLTRDDEGNTANCSFIVQVASMTRPT